MTKGEQLRALLRHHVSGAIERGVAVAITEQPVEKESETMQSPITLASLYVDQMQSPHAESVKREVLAGMDKAGDTEVHLRAVPIRFFGWERTFCHHCNGMGENRHGMCDRCNGTGESEYSDIVEISAQDFARHVDNGVESEYARDTVKENGVSQICMTLAQHIED